MVTHGFTNHLQTTKVVLDRHEGYLNIAVFILLELLNLLG